MRKLFYILKKLDTYDRIYYGGKLMSALIVFLCFLSIGCFILAFIVFK